MSPSANVKAGHANRLVELHPCFHGIPKSSLSGCFRMLVQLRRDVKGRGVDFFADEAAGGGVARVAGTLGCCVSTINVWTALMAGSTVD